MLKTPLENQQTNKRQLCCLIQKHEEVISVKSHAVESTAMFTFLCSAQDTTLELSGMNWSEFVPCFWEI